MKQFRKFGETLVNRNLRKNEILWGIETKTPVNIEFTGVMKWSETLSVTELGFKPKTL